MEYIKNAADVVKQSVTGEQPERSGAECGAYDTSGTAHKTSEVPQTGSGVVSSLSEAGHRAQEQQGADHAGYYEAQAKLTSAAERANEKLSGSS